jgi:hypothetical protein
MSKSNGKQSKKNKSKNKTRVVHTENFDPLESKRVKKSKSYVLT